MEEWEDGCDLSDNVIAPPLLLVRKCTRGTQGVIECICYVGRLSYDNVRERSTRTYRKEQLEKLLDLICVVPIPL